jgi:hypothetical protein
MFLLRSSPPPLVASGIGGKVKLELELIVFEFKL